MIPMTASFSRSSYKTCLCLFTLLATSLAHAGDRFVSPAGNDANDGRAPESAFRSVAAAAKATPAGAHTIRLAAGDYPETESTLLAPGVSLTGAGIGKTIIRWSARQESRQTKAAPETDKTAIRATNTANASISGFTLIGNLPDNQRANTGIVVHGANNVSIHDCEVKGFEFTGIWMHDAVKSTIRNARLDDNGLPHKDSCSGGLQVGHMTDCSIHHNTIRENRGAYGIKTCIPEWTLRNDPWSAPKAKLVRVLIHDNDIKLRQQGGWGQGQPNMAIELWHSEPDTCEIYQNRINTCVSLVEGANAAKTIRVHHNLFILDPGYNYAIEAGHHNMEIDHNVFRNGIYPIATWGGPPDNLNVHDNVFDGIEDVVLLSFTGATNFRFANNTVVFKKDMPVLSLGKHGKESRGILIADNVFVKEGGDPMAADMLKEEADNKSAPGSVTIRGNLFWNWKPAGADSQSANPMLVREPDGDRLLKLAPDSPALKAGKGTPGGKLPAVSSDPLVDAVFNRMSQEDKFAELQGIWPGTLFENGTLSPEKCRQLIPHGVGQLCQFASSMNLPPEKARDMARQIQAWLMTETPARIPAIVHDEGITGFPGPGATTFPQSIGMACTWNPEIIERKARLTSADFRATGTTLALSPVLDVCRDAQWPRMEEGFGEDPYLVSIMGLAFIRGMQGDDLRNGVATTCKHFAGYGGETTDRRVFIEEYLLPHETAIRTGSAQAIMPGYHAYNGKLCIENHELLGDILRDHLGFQGLVVSDYGAMDKLNPSNAESAMADIAAKCLNAGADVELPKGTYFSALLKAGINGKVSQATLDAAVKRSLTLKARLGLLDDVVKTGRDGPLDFDPPEHRKLAYDAACQSLVLLKNNGVLPLAPEAKHIAVLGPNADSIQALLGDYTYQALAAFWQNRPIDPNHPKLVTLLAGLQKRLGGDVKLLHERGCDWSEGSEGSLDSSGTGDTRLNKDGNERIKKLVHEGVPAANPDLALRHAAASDVIIAAMGENMYLSGEGRERPGIRLPGQQEAFVKRLLDTGRPVVLVIFGGRPQIIDDLEPRCAAVIQAWYPGEEGGHAVADLLLGRINPSGKLCVTYPSAKSKRPSCYNEGYSSDAPPMYPFGHGLSYTRFDYRDLKLPENPQTTDREIPVSFRVKNSGPRAGAEIAQVYVSPKKLSVPAKPIQLKAFKRVELDQQAESEVSVAISPEQLACWNDREWVIEPGEYEILAASSASDVRLRGTVHLGGGLQRLKHRTHPSGQPAW